MSWKTILPMMGRFLTGWLSFATPKRLDFEAVTAAWKTLSHELREEIHRVRSQSEIDNRRTRRELRRLQGQLDECQTNCEHERELRRKLQQEVTQLSGKVDAIADGHGS